MMEVVLTRLRDFSSKDATFDACKSTVPVVSGDPRTIRDPCPEEGLRMAGCMAGVQSSSTYKLDIESALAWLRRELMEMRSQDQALIRQLMDLHAGIQELKLECAEAEEEEEEDDETEEEGSWDFGSEAGGSGSSVYSSSGEVGFSISCLSTRMTPPPLGSSLPRRTSSRRSSLP
ncbi:glutamate-rich protein 4 [Oncorhynchus clarkii lewisi]